MKKYRFLQEATANKRGTQICLHERSLTLNKLRESENGKGDEIIFNITSFFLPLSITHGME